MTATEPFLQLVNDICGNFWRWPSSCLKNFVSEHFCIDYLGWLDLLGSTCIVTDILDSISSMYQGCNPNRSKRK